MKSKPTVEFRSIGSLADQELEICEQFSFTDFCETLDLERGKDDDEEESNLIGQFQAVAKRTQELNEQFQSARVKMTDKFNDELEQKDMEKQELINKLKALEVKHKEFYKKEEEKEEIQGFATQELEKLKHMVILKEEELAKCQTEQAEKTQTLDNVQLRNAVLSTEVSSAHEKLKTSETARLKLEEESVKHGKMVSALTRERMGLEQSLTESKAHLADVSSSLSALQASHTDMENTHQTLVRNFDLHKNKSSQMLQEKVDQIEQLQDRIKLLEQRDRDQTLTGDERIVALEKEREGLEGKVEETREQLSQVKSSWSEKISHLEEQVCVTLDLTVDLNYSRTEQAFLEHNYYTLSARDAKFDVSPDDLYCTSYIQDGDLFKENLDVPKSDPHYREPSPNTAALLVTNGCLSPAPVSRTRDGKPRVMDLNSLGLHVGVPHQQPTSSKYDNLNTKWTDRRPVQTPDYASYDQASTAKAESSMPPDAFAWNVERLQRMEDATNRVQQSHVSVVRNRYATTDPDDLSRHAAYIPRPMEPVPPPSPVCWEQDQVRRSRRATDRIQQEYVDELRRTTLPAVPTSRNTINTSNEPQTEQMMIRMRVRQQLEKEQLRQDRQLVRQEMFRPVSSKKRTPPPPATPCYPATQTYNTRCNDVKQDNTMAPIHEEARLSEIELDRKRDQLMAKKIGKSKKEGKKRKKKKEQQTTYTSEVIDWIGHMEPEDIPEFVPHRPAAPPPKTKDREVESYSKRHRKLIGMVQNTEQSVQDNTRESYASSISQSERTDRECYVSDPVNHDTGSDNRVPHPPLIPRQTSQQTMCWNSDTAKRGLGFKSKLRREEESKSKLSSTKPGILTPEVREKWKAATFY